MHHPEASFNNLYFSIWEVLVVENVIPLISEVGFPIVVSLYLLYRIETKLNTLIDTMQKLPKRLMEERLL